MNVSSEAEINAPIEAVFSEFTNFVSFESYALKRGLDVERTDDMMQIGAGMAWHVSGEMRGKERNIDVVMETYAPHHKLKYACESQSMDATVRLMLKPLSPSLTHIKVVISPEAKNISARLILQSAKLARNTLEKRLKKRLRNFGEYIEQKHAVA